MNAQQSHSLEQTPESAVVAFWTDLTRGAKAGLVHIEYSFAAGGTLDYLKFWSSISRGHWLLAVEYWASPSKSHSTGVHFENGYESEPLKHVLDWVCKTKPE